MNGIVKIHGKEYKTVALRVAEFRAAHPDYTISTELVEANDVLVIMKATVSAAGMVIATGHAEEVRAASKINSQAAMEVAESSAVGRALAFFGLAGEELSIASADEVAHAIQQQQDTGPIMAHNEALQRNYASVYFIKEHLALKAWEAVAEAWGEISNDDKKALWVAPSKGGIFTTAERSDLKSNEFNEARKLILGETA
jgi:hypothetical protein